MDWTVFNQLPVTINEKLKQQINSFYELLVEENKKYNLTRIVDKGEMLNKHFLDSLLFTKDLVLTNQKLVDIGTGAGFPGIVLKFFYPDLDVTLIEASQKKAKFLTLAIKNFHLKKIKVINERAEDYARKNRDQFDIVVSRAVATLRILLELGAPLLKNGGFLVALKGPKAPEEATLIYDLDDKLGLSLDHHQIFKDYNYGVRINLFYQKKGSTPSIYPRPYRVIKKEIDNLRKK